MSSWSMPSPETPIAADQRCCRDRSAPSRGRSGCRWRAGPGSGFCVHCCGVSAGAPRMKPTWADDVADDQRRLQAGREGIELGDRPRERAGRAAELAVGEIGPRDVADRRGRRRRSGRSARSDRRRRSRAAGTKLAHVGDRDWPSSSAAAIGAREERRGARLLQRDVDAEDRRVGRADDAEHRAVGVDHRDRDLGAAVERAADLGARAAHDLERFLEDRADFGGGQRGAGGVGAGADRIAVRARAVGEDEGVGIGEFGGGRGADARGFGAVGAAGDDAVAES